jgi:spore germination protein YaaH
MLLPHALLYGRRDADAEPGSRRQLLAVLSVVLAVMIPVAVQWVRPTPQAAGGGTAAARPAADPGAARPATGPGAALPVVVGYLPYWAQPAAVADAVRGSDLLTVAAPWWYAPTDSGDVVEQHPEFTDTGDHVLRRLRAEGLVVMPTIANHRDGEWDFEVVPHVIADRGTRSAHVRNLVDLVEDRGFDGIVIDYELLGAGDRDNFTAFVTELGTALHANDRQLAVALHAQASDAGSGGHNVAQDYRAIGRVADQVHLMTYDLHYDESDPGPIAPLPWLTDVLGYATERIPPEKLLLGIGLFAYDWPEGRTADDLQLAQVDRRIASNEGEQGWDERAMAPWFRYRSDGVARTIWYEDARSVEAKLALVARYDLAGAFVWRLGGVPEDIWRVTRQTLRPEM